ncbi:diphthamide biosynthesis protein 3 [Geosmithia morbida]|uniref:Diphthamide biosynthesis protein 3 n=1 Tax=Geosmithia morbida TaxID=1094350 RepID=A0A9P4Z1C6_9HYPO|nr:diphthamide biosynthesis protein 3 [Geosmithia morbida]KAF4126327.1 diphthamide biosynthesis protein 3 [Geosmithia morbida]
MSDDGLSIYDEIEIEDMTFDEALQLYNYPCPCGDKFQIALEDLRDEQDIAVCPSCSLMIRVIFDLDDLPEPPSGGGSTTQVPIAAGRHVCARLRMGLEPPCQEPCAGVDGRALQRTLSKSCGASSERDACQLRDEGPSRDMTEAPPAAAYFWWYRKTGKLP